MVNLARLNTPTPYKSPSYWTFQVLILREIQRAHLFQKKLKITTHRAIWIWDAQTRILPGRLHLRKNWLKLNISREFIRGGEEHQNLRDTPIKDFVWFIQPWRICSSLWWKWFIWTSSLRKDTGKTSKRPNLATYQHQGKPRKARPTIWIERKFFKLHRLEKPDSHTREKKAFNFFTGLQKHFKNKPFSSSLKKPELNLTLSRQLKNIVHLNRFDLRTFQKVGKRVLILMIVFGYLVLLYNDGRFWLLVTEWFNTIDPYAHRKLSYNTLMEEVKSKILDKYELEYRDMQNYHHSFVLFSLNIHYFLVSSRPQVESCRLSSWRTKSSV